MVPGFGIAGIGYPSMGLGTLGLGTSSCYGSYDSYMPSMIGMNMPGMNANLTGMGMMNPMMGMSGMMSMYNPLYYTQMQGAAEQIQAQHAGNMHTTLVQNEVNAQRETDSALIQKMLTNADVVQGIENLNVAIKSGNQDDVCRQFDILKENILNTYQDEFQARGSKSNRTVSATNIINRLYGRIISADTEETVDLRSDIKRYCETSTMNGFMNGFRDGHGNRYVDHTLNHIFGDAIEDKRSKDARKTVATGVGRVASVLEKGVYGAAGAAAAGGIAYGLVRFGVKPLLPESWGKHIKFNNKAARIVITAGAILGAAADIWWQCSGSRDSSSSAA